MSRPSSWSGWRKNSSDEQEYDTVSLQDLNAVRTVDSTNSGTGLISGTGRGEDANWSSAYRGVKQLFLGKFDPSLADDQDHQHAESNRRPAPQLSQQSQQDPNLLSASRPQTMRRPSDRSASSMHSSDDDLIDLSNLDAIKDGLNEALGQDGNGAWLAPSDRDSAVDPNNRSSIISGPSGSRSNLSSSRRASAVSDGESEAGRMDAVSLAEEGRSPQKGSTTNLAPPPMESKGKQLSSMVLNVSSRVVSGMSRGSSPRSSMQPQRSSTSIHSGAGFNASSTSLQSDVDSFSGGIDMDPRHGELNLPPHRRVFPDNQTPESWLDSEYRPDHLKDSIDPLAPAQESQTASTPLISPLYGRSLRLFPKNSHLRIALNRFLHQPWVEPVLFLIIVCHLVVLAFDTAPNIFVSRPEDDLFHHWGAKWSDFVLLGIFLIYTVEAVAKIIAYGLWDDSEIFDHDNPAWTTSKSFEVFRRRNQSQASVKSDTSYATVPVPTMFRTVTSLLSANPSLPLKKRQAGVRRAYLRSSWNRVDFISVICYWIALAMRANHFSSEHKFFVFNMLSSLKLLRLLNITHGTSAVLQAIKTSAPLLANISIFITFFCILFAIIGVQSFKSSLRRTCVWVDPNGIDDNYTTSQFCGSYLHPETLEIMPYVYPDGTPGAQAKGFACPVNSYCVSDVNPHDNTVSFDNFFNSLEMVFVIMSENTFSDIMYYTTETDYMAASLYFVAGILVLYLWLANLVIAIIVSSFKLVRNQLLAEDTSYFSRILRRQFDGTGKHLEYLTRHYWGRLYHRFRFIWVLVIVADIIVQCTLTNHSSESHINFIYRWQIWTTTVLGVEILLRFFLYFPYWRQFFKSKTNVVDTIFAIANIIIVLPWVHHHEEIYQWLTIFQIARFYRAAMLVPFPRELWSKVLAGYRTIFNLTLFLFLLTFISSILACQLFQGVVPFEDDGEVQDVSFYDLANSFVGMYVISSTENWTDILYPAIEAMGSVIGRVCAGIFLIGWFLFSNFIILNLFIAVISENLEVSEEDKRKEQIRQFVREYALKLGGSSDHYLTGGIKLVKGMLKRRKTKGHVNPESGESVFDMLLERQVVAGFLANNPGLMDEDDAGEDPTNMGSKTWYENKWRKFKDSVEGFVMKIFKRQTTGENPFLDSRNIIDDHGDGDPDMMAKNFLASHSERRKRMATFLEENPHYDVSVYFFSPQSKVRRFCQRLVPPSYGVRENQVNPKPAVWYIFFVVMLLATCATVTAACINTPLYYKSYMQDHHSAGNSWMTISGGVFAAIFTIEAMVRIIADGFMFTPNAYMRSTWNRIDFIVLISIWINFVSELRYGGNVSRYMRCFQALRALRLLTISKSAQETFHNVIIVGIGKIMGAAMVSFCLLFPYTVWGLNLFNGKLTQCTDEDVANFNECVNEYKSTPFNWEVYAPRALDEPYYDFNSFPHSLLVMFGIISLEGWVDVLDSVMSITGKGYNPVTFASRYNGIFPISYNILSTVFILTLFVSVIIKNYSQVRGTAYLTDEQLSWYETKKVIKLARPSRVPPTWKSGSFRDKVLKQVLKWERTIIKIERAMLTVLVILLALEFYPFPPPMYTARVSLILVVVVVMEFGFLCKLYAQGFVLFVRHRWEVYGLLITTGALIVTIIGIDGMWNDVYYNIQKSLLVGMLLLWIPRSGRLDQFFKTGSASFEVIGNLLVTWFILFLGYAIAFNQLFGLTKIGPSGGPNQNFRTIGSSLLLLFQMSCGEGWNELMVDFLISPPFCYRGNGFSQTDCGSKPFAYLLFISWNIISMYIFANMCISLIVENFSYVFEGSQSDISKNDLRQFKKAWLQFDPHGTGYIPVGSLHKLLHKVEGYFSMRIYDGNYTVGKLMDHARIEHRDGYQVDYEALNGALSNLPKEYYQKQREKYDYLCMQAMMEAHPQKGISFHSLMLLIPLYKTMDENKCLRLDDYLKRKMVLKTVREELLKRRLAGFLEMIYLQKKLAVERARNPFKTPDNASLISGRGGVVPMINVTGIYNPFDSDESQHEQQQRQQHQHQHQQQQSHSQSALGTIRLGPPAEFSFERSTEDLTDRGRQHGNSGSTSSSSSSDDYDAEAVAESSSYASRHLTEKSTSPRRGGSRKLTDRYSDEDD